jgi:hypothetical protein
MDQLMLSTYSRPTAHHLLHTTYSRSIAQQLTKRSLSQSIGNNYHDQQLIPQQLICYTSLSATQAQHEAHNSFHAQQHNSSPIHNAQAFTKPSIHIYTQLSYSGLVDLFATNLIVRE